MFVQRKMMIGACAIAVLGFTAAPAVATTLDVYWTRDPTVTGRRPDPAPPHNGWFPAPTSGSLANKVMADADSKFWVAFLNDGPRTDPKRMTIEVSTTDPDATGPRQNPPKRTEPENPTGGYSGDDRSVPVPFDWSGYTYGARDEGGTTVKYWKSTLKFDDCPRWEVIEFENVNDFPVLFTITATSQCGCDEVKKTSNLLTDVSIASTDAVTAESEIVEISVYPLLAAVDPAQLPEFSRPGWGHELTYAAPDGELRPLGGYRFFMTDGLPILVGEEYSLSFNTMDRSYGMCEEYAYDRISEEHDLYLHELAAPPWYEPFDLLFEVPGETIEYQRGWKGWHGEEVVDATVTNVPFLSPPFAAEIAGPAHVVREFRALEEPGVYAFTSSQLVPLGYVSGGVTDDSGLGLLSQYEDDGDHAWSVFYNFDSNDGMLKVYYGNGMNTVDVPYRPDEWVEAEIRIDLEQDWTQVYYDGELVTEYQWTGGIYGDGTGLRDIAAVSLFANDSSSVFHDDLRLLPCAPWEEDFASYAAGSNLQDRIGWKGWDGEPVLAGIVTDAPARSIPNAVEVGPQVDAVREHCTSGRGAWSYSAWQYIPLDFVSGGATAPPGTYFLLLDTYDDFGPYHWAVIARFDSNDGMLKVQYGNGLNTVDVPYHPEEWVEIEVQVDFDVDWTEVYYDGALVVGYPWTGGAYGEGGGVLDIAVVDLYANGSSPVYYDDLKFKVMLPCPADTDGSGTVDTGDLVGLLAAWGPCGECPQDIDGSGTVDTGDLILLLAAWGPCP